MHANANLLCRRLFQNLCLSVLLSGVVSCGDLGSLTSELNNIANQDTPASGVAQVQGEVQKVLAMAQMGIIGGITSTTVDFGDCNPEMGWDTTGFMLKFNEEAGCPLLGDIRMTLVPLGIQTDLELSGLKHIGSMSFDANLVLSRGNGGLTFGYEFKDGRIAINTDSQFFTGNELILNGFVNATIARRKFEFNSRTNFFADDTLNGLSLLTYLKRDRTQSPVLRERELQGCSLAGGVASDPRGGTLANCRSLSNQGG